MHELDSHTFAGPADFTNSVYFNNRTLRNVGTPCWPSDAATKSYVDSKQFSTANLANGAVTADKLANNAVTSATIADGAVATADLADGAVTSAKIADGTITAADLASGAVTADKLANGAVTAAKLHHMGAAIGQVLKWNGSTWVPAPDAGGMSQAEADVRYVNAGGDTMTGPLTAPELRVAGNWAVGGPGNAHIVRVGNNAAGSVQGGWTVSKTVVHNLNIAGSYIVIVTPTSQATTPYFVTSKTANSFEVKATSGFAFDYLIIGR